MFIILKKNNNNINNSKIIIKITSPSTIEAHCLLYSFTFTFAKLNSARPIGKSVAQISLS